MSIIQRKTRGMCCVLPSHRHNDWRCCLLELSPVLVIGFQTNRHLNTDKDRKWASYLFISFASCPCLALMTLSRAVDCRLYAGTEVSVSHTMNEKWICNVKWGQTYFITSKIKNICLKSKIEFIFDLGWSQIEATHIWWSGGAMTAPPSHVNPKLNIQEQ